MSLRRRVAPPVLDAPRRRLPLQRRCWRQTAPWPSAVAYTAAPWPTGATATASTAAPWSAGATAAASTTTPWPSPTTTSPQFRGRGRRLPPPLLRARWRALPLIRTRRSSLHAPPRPTAPPASHAASCCAPASRARPRARSDGTLLFSLSTCGQDTSVRIRCIWDWGDVTGH
jgi:hypothetical protein